MVHEIYILEIVFGFDEVVFGHADPAEDHVWLVHFIVQIHFFDDAFEQVFAVFAIVDGEIGRVS